jgi:predicted PurR-regulated permease PerM
MSGRSVDGHRLGINLKWGSADQYVGIELVGSAIIGTGLIGCNLANSVLAYLEYRASIRRRYEPTNRLHAGTRIRRQQKGSRVTTPNEGPTSDQTVSNTDPQPGPLPSAEPGVLKIEVEGRIVWQAIAAVLATLVLLWALNQARGIVSMVAISFFFSLALDPAVRRLTARFGWRRGAAVGVVYVGGTLFVFLLIAVLIPTLAELAKSVGENGAQWINNMSEFANDNLGFEVTGVETAADLAENTDIVLSEWADEVFGTVLGVATSGIGLIFNLATIAMFTFYLTADAPRVQQAVLRLFTSETQQRIGWTWDQAIEQTGGYFYSRMILMVINGTGFFFTMVAVGVPTAIALSLALFGGFVSVFIPAIGTYIGGAVPILISWALQGLTAGLIVLGYVLLYQQLENYWLSPKISSDTMTLNGGVAFGAALAGGAIAGPMGAFTALPVAALLSSFISNYYASNEVVYQSPSDTAEEQSESRRKRKKRKKAAESGEG